MSGTPSTVQHLAGPAYAAQRRRAVRLLKAMGREVAQEAPGRVNVGAGTPGPAGGMAVLVLGGGRRLRIEADVLHGLERAGLLDRVACRSAEANSVDAAEDVENGLRVSAEGRAWLRRVLAGGDDAFRRQHQARGRDLRPGEAGEAVAVEVDLSESPLAWLARRRRPGGAPWLSTAQLQAGERLRSDFSRGGLQARVTLDWSRLGGAGDRPRGGAQGVRGEAAMAARDRTRQALAAVGPGLADVLVDVCCHERGLEAAERMHGWPARSGKVILSIALDRLAAHYGYGHIATGRDTAAMRGWAQASAGNVPVNDAPASDAPASDAS